MTHTKLIFVGGIARSGTTLAQNVLDSHPDVRGLPEFFMTVPIAGLRPKFQDLIDREMITDICEQREADQRLRRFLEAFLLDGTNGNGPVRYVSEKTPDNLFVFPTLLELFPDAKLIEVVRDPRAVIHSLLEVAREARRLNRPVPPSMQSLASAIPYVRLGHEVGETARKSAPHRYFVLKYEALVLQPDSVTRALCDFLGLDWSKNMLTPGEFEHATERPITSNPEWYDEKRFKRNIERTSLTRWQREMPSHRQIRITKAFENHGRLRELGYEPTLEHLPSSERALGSVVSALRKTAGDSRLYLQRLLD